MAIGFASVLYDYAAGTNLTSRETTNAYTPGAGTKQVAFVLTQGGSVGMTAAANGTMAGCGMTWACVDSFYNNSSANGFAAFHTTGGTPANGKLTYTAGGSDNFNKVSIIVVEVSVCDTGNLAQFKNNETEYANATVTTASLSPAMTSGNALLAAFAFYDANCGATTPRTDWTELVEADTAWGSYAVDYRATGTDTAASLNMNYGNYRKSAMVLEIKAAASGPSVPVLMNLQRQFRA